MNSLEKELHYFIPTSLDEIKIDTLKKRTETKFVCTKDILPKLLHSIADNYKILEVNEERILPCCNIYYDTNDSQMYYDHVNNKNTRFKIRSRCYSKTNENFFEIKFRKDKSQTIKSRIERQSSQTELSSEEGKFLTRNSPFEPFELKTKLITHFQRITFTDSKEQFTIDLDLQFQNISGSERAEYEQLIVIEVKQSEFNEESAILTLLKEHNITPICFSKYCFGAAALKKAINFEVPDAEKVLEQVLC